VDLKQTGGPLGALAVLARADPSLPGPETWTSLTDAEGRYQIRSIKPGANYVLAADHDLWAAVEVPVVVPPEGELVEDIVLVGGYLVHGYVMDNTGSPVVGAELTLMPLMEAQLRPFDPTVPRETTLVDETGRYRFEHVSAGMRALTVRAKGYGTKTAPNVSVGGSPDDPIEQDFRLEPGVAIAGTIVSPGRQPIAGARVEAISFTSEMSSRALATSDEQGRFRIEDVGVGQYTVRATAEGWGEAREDRVEGGRTDVRIELVEQGGVAGAVIEGASGRPVPDFTIDLRLVNPQNSLYGRSMLRRPFQGRTDGRFELGGVDHGRYVLEASAPGFAPAYSDPFDVVQGIVTPDVVVRLSTGGSIVGRVVDAGGAPVAGAKIETQDNGFIRNPFQELLGGMVPRTTTVARGRSDADGRFEIALLAPEVYQLEVSHPEFTTLVLRDVRVADSPTATELGALLLARGASIRGTVYDQSGVPALNATVNLTGNPTQPGLSYQARTTSSGTYVIEHVQPGGYQLHALRDTTGGNPFDGLVDMHKSRVDVNLFEGSEIVQDLFLGGR
ncbi:MAG TPA: carboxypeptidase-like regulatory domain-containing protein, partial [Planctomycetota bacterium]|nr:carboxypeptidase-like regulatory domain-containing protein [Planctomycetota bacterium]